MVIHGGKPPGQNPAYRPTDILLRDDANLKLFVNAVRGNVEACVNVPFTVPDFAWLWGSHQQASGIVP